MKTIDVSKRPLNVKDFEKRSAKANDCSTLIRESCVLKEDGKVVLVYLKDFVKDNSLLSLLQKIQYNRTDRSRGLITNSRIFGWSPRITHRRDYCSSTGLAEDFPFENMVVCDLAVSVEKIYRDFAPEIWSEHRLKAGKIRDDYHLSESVYTSGIINKDNPLNYHFDSGNIPDTFSSMIVLREDVEGGFLNLPEYDVALDCANGSLVIFNGQGILHGVSPIQKLSSSAVRFSIVYYSLLSLWKCLPLNEEIARIRERKAQREIDRHAMASGKMPIKASLKKQLSNRGVDL